MQPTSYRGHAAIAGLVALAETSLPGVRVIDGPAANKPSEKTLLMVGWAPWVDRHAASRRSEEGLTGRMTEQGEVACYIAVGHGDTNIVPVRERAVEILEQLEQAIRADQTRLGGAVDHAFIGEGITLTQYQDPNEGASVGLAFAVSYEAYI